MISHNIKTKRLWLRPCILEDLDNLFKLWTDKSVKQYFWDNDIISKEDAHKAIVDSQTLFSKYNFGQWIILLKKNDEFIGSIGLLSEYHHYFDRDTLRDDLDKIEINFSILEEKRNHGYATEANQSIINYAINLGLRNRVISLVDEPNLASIKVIEKSGMRHYENQIISGQKVRFYRLFCS
jgi:RimJ/RimL family protein N-acetyltransferase